MHINRLIALLFLASLIGAGFGAAHMWRYAPLPSADTFDFAPVWDRWQHRRCVVSLLRGNELICTEERLKEYLPGR